MDGYNAIKPVDSILLFEFDVPPICSIIIGFSLTPNEAGENSFFFNSQTRKTGAFSNAEEVKFIVLFFIIINVDLHFGVIGRN